MVAAELHFVRTVSPWFPDPDTLQLHLKLPRGSPVPALTPGLSRARAGLASQQLLQTQQF